MNDARLFALQEFMLTYLHQDWMHDDATTLDVARRFRRESEPSFRAAVVDDIRGLLRRDLPEDALHEHLPHKYSVAYDPWRDEITTREWLTQLLREIQGDE